VVIRRATPDRCADAAPGGTAGSSWPRDAQRLDTDDRIAFPFGCRRRERGLHDRYCSDGSFDLYDFRSEGERRTTRRAGPGPAGPPAHLGGCTHRWRPACCARACSARFQRPGLQLGRHRHDRRPDRAAPRPTLTDENTNRDERSTEWRLQDAVTLTPQWQACGPARATPGCTGQRAHRRQRDTDYTQSFTTPWLALAASSSQRHHGLRQLGPGHRVHGRTQPRRATPTPARRCPRLKSRQTSNWAEAPGRRRCDWNWRCSTSGAREWSDIARQAGDRGLQRRRPLHAAWPMARAPPRTRR
jgi:iron complex outermembrane receptor protein